MSTEMVSTVSQPPVQSSDAPPERGLELRSQLFSIKPTDQIQPNSFVSSLSEKVIHAAHQGWWGRISSFSQLKKEFQTISPEELKLVLEKVAKEIDGKEILEALSRILPLEKLDQAIRDKAFESVKEMARDAHFYLEKVKMKNPSIKTHFLKLIDKLISVFESFLNAFGIAEFFKPVDAKSDGRAKAQLLMMLLQFSVLATSLVLPVFGAGVAGFVVASTLFSIWTLSLIYPYINPRPRVLPSAENWGRQYQFSQLSVGVGRQKAVDQVASILAANNTVKIHPILLGESGVGKTETAKLLVESIKKGRYPELKGKEIFYINTADLSTDHTGSDVLNRISEIMGRHRENVILIFDEIHTACHAANHSILASRLKSFLSEGNGKFPHIVGITTCKEFYAKVLSHNSDLSRHFKKVFINSTESNETIKILKGALWKNGSKILLEPNVLDLLIQKSEEAFGAQTPQPATALKILSLCVKKVSETEKSPLEVEIERLNNEIDILHQKGGKHSEIVRLESELEKLRSKQVAERADLVLLESDRNYLSHLKKTMYEAALKIQSVASKDAVDQFLLLDRFIIPALEEKILNRAGRYGVRVQINSQIIDEVIKDEMEEGQKFKALASRKPHESFSP